LDLSDTYPNHVILGRRVAPRWRDRATPRFINVRGLKKAAASLYRDWLFAAFDGTTLPLLPDVPRRGERAL
jgi:hypothetical protein